MSNICKHCKKEFNFILPDGLCSGCRDYINAKNINKIPDGEPFNKSKFVEKLTEVQTEINKIREYDFSDFDNLSEENEFFGLPYDEKNDSLIKQYIQTKIDQEVKKRDNTPMGASKWKELGVKYGYYEYFRKEEVKKVLEEIKNDISKNSDKKLNFGWSMNDCEYGCMNEILNLIDNYLK